MTCRTGNLLKKFLTDLLNTSIICTQKLGKEHMKQIINEYPISVKEKQSILIPLSGVILPQIQYVSSDPSISISVLSEVGDMRMGGRMVYMFQAGTEIPEYSMSYLTTMYLYTNTYHVFV